jgi:hypothetical protein
MAVRSTSRESLSALVRHGKVSIQHKKILDYLSEISSAMTMREIQRATGIDINAVSGRCNELKREKRLFEYPKRKCSVTDRLVIPLHTNDPAEPGGQGMLFAKSETRAKAVPPHYHNKW